MNVAAKLKYKTVRYQKLRKTLGAWSAFRFESAWTSRREVIRISLPNYREAFSVRRNSSDIFVFQSVFIERELDAFVAVNPKLIVDAGANIGFTTAYFAHKFPDARVVAVEPSPANCERWRMHCHQFDNTMLLHGAVWHENTRLTIANPADDSWAFRVIPSPIHDQEEVQAFTISDIVARSGRTRIDLLKLDIEGAERDLFAKNSAVWLPLVDALLVEIHGDDAKREVFAACTDAGFKATKCGEKYLFARLGAKG